MRPLFRNRGPGASDAPAEPVLIAFDSSYCVFHRHHAMRRYERLSGQRGPEPNANPASERELVAFGDSLRAALVAQARTYGATHYALMMDCARADIWRRDLQADYKASRAAPTDLPPNLFPYFHDVVAPALQADLNVRLVGCPRAEADDVAQVLADWAVDRGMQVVIVTGDADLAQLCRPGVRVVDLKGECVLKKACTKTGCAESAAAYLAVKLLIGDKGDNIAPVRPRMGAKTALKAVTDLDRELQDADVKTRYERNRVLMDLSMMPPDIRTGIKDAIATAFPDADNQRRDGADTGGEVHDADRQEGGA